MSSNQEDGLFGRDSAPKLIPFYVGYSNDPDPKCYRHGLRFGDWSFEWDFDPIFVCELFTAKNKPGIAFFSWGRSDP